MNNTLCLCCVRCEQTARFLCGRCSDPYCSKTCQLMHWPFHRTMCLQMPSLLEIPTTGSLMFPRSNNSPAIEYPSWAAHQSNVSPNTYRRTNNYKNSICSSGGPPSKEIQRKKNDSRDHYTLNAKKPNQELETQRSSYRQSQKFEQPPKDESRKLNQFSENKTQFSQLPKYELRKSENSFPMYDQSKNSQFKSNVEMPQLTKAESQKTGRFTPSQEKITQRPQRLELPQLTKAELKNSEKIMPLPENGAKRLLPMESKNFEDQSAIRDPLIWQKPFLLPEHDFEVIVQYSVENPTSSCWVVQGKHIKERDNLLAETKKLQSYVEAVGEKEIRINELYCVQRENIYHRGVVVYQINSKEVVVRLIDDGRSFQTLITAVKPLHTQLKFINAFALEINFETPMEVHIGETLQIEKFSIDAVGAINVQLANGGKSNEVDLIPVPLGVPMELFCLDCSNIEKGYISACKNEPQKNESINNLSEKINEYIRKFQKGGEKYFPKLDEMCLVYHVDEKQWYRAECVEIINSSSVEVLFIDYGNTKIVNVTNVRKIVPEFMEPAIMHFFRIYGVPHRPNSDLVTKIKCFFDENPIFSITRVDKLDDMQVIHCPDLLNFI